MIDLSFERLLQYLKLLLQNLKRLIQFFERTNSISEIVDLIKKRRFKFRSYLIVNDVTT